MPNGRSPAGVPAQAETGRPEQGALGGAQPDPSQALGEALGAEAARFQAMGEAMQNVGAPPEAAQIVQQIIQMIQQLSQVIGQGGRRPQAGQQSAEAAGTLNAVPTGTMP